MGFLFQNSCKDLDPFNKTNLDFWGCFGRGKGHVITEYPKILKFGTPQTIAIIVLKIEKFDVTLH